MRNTRLVKRALRLAPLRRISLKLLMGIAAVGLPMLLSKPAHTATPEKDFKVQRDALHARVARVRAAIEIESGTVVEDKAQGPIAQWYNWGNWSNGWNNYWSKWPNGWWNY